MAQGVGITAMMKALQSFSGSTVSGRFQWAAKDSEEQRKLVDSLERIIRRSFDGTYQWDRRIFDLIHAEQVLKSGQATYELHWSAPAMPMETNPWVIFAFGGASTLAFLSVVIVSTIYKWQTVPAAFLLVGGQAVLATGHVAAQWTLRRLRTTVYLDFPRSGFSDTWMLVDNVWFTSMVARRPLIGISKTDHLRVGQYLEMKSRYIPTWQAILTLVAIGIGFIAFYVGAKSSNAYTILMYIVLFLAINMAKGSVVAHANRAEVVYLNNHGFRNLLQSENEPLAPRRPWWQIFRRRRDTTSPSVDNNVHGDSTNDGHAVEMSNLPQLDGQSYQSSKHSLSRGLFVANRSPLRSEDDFLHPINIPLPPSTSSDLSYQISDNQSCAAAQIPLPPSEGSLNSGTEFSRFKVQYRVFAKIALRDTLAMGMFYFGRPQAWGMAAHIIHDACQRHVVWQWPPNLREPFIYFPLGYQTHSNDFVEASLILFVDETRHEDVFWSAGMEFMSILLDNFNSDTHLLSELPLSASIELLGLYVYHVTKLLFSASRGDGQETAVFDTPGRASLMRAIDLVKIKYPYDDTDVTLPTLRAYAEAATQL
ncbi:hypothetical protein MSAN_02351000 [Mycena sanguinolenta]|uniref:Uncharacterized protein n=1 Tax=Mycena sanguinolenta TaxID=230812 RepID=A0A8H6X635_9AGAR|nr:hypothetical protein MSAN_02351000 [Mycena sanguinolenta]